MSKIVGFKMGKGITVEAKDKGKDKKTWKRRYLELEVQCAVDFSTESLQSSFAKAENVLDFWLGQPGPGQEAARIPELDLEAIKSLPWKTKEKEPAPAGAWGWILGPESDRGVEPMAEALAAALEKAEDHELVMGDVKYSFSKNKAFINRAPVKQESAK